MAVTREQVVRTAIQLLDEGGLHHLTLRRLAAELGVQAPALYWHVRNKRELLDLMAEEIAAGAVPETEHEAPLGKAFWDWWAQRAVASRRALLSHPDGALVAAGNRPTAGMLPRIEALLRAFAAQGFPPGEALAAILSFGNLVAGSALEEQASAQRPAESTERDRAVFREVAETDRYPLLGRVLREGAPDGEQVFEYAVGLMVAGLRARQQALAPGLGDLGLDELAEQFDGAVQRLAAEQVERSAATRSARSERAEATRSARSERAEATRSARSERAAAARSAQSARTRTRRDRPGGE